MQPPGCSNLYTGTTGHGGYYPPPALAYLQQQGIYAAPPQALQDQQSEPSVQTCVRDSVRLLGEAVAVLEGVRLLGSQLLRWGGELHHIVQSFVPAALLLQIYRWLYSRTLGASRRRTLSRMRRAWQEASGVGRPGPKVPLSSSNSSIVGFAMGRKGIGGYLSVLRDLSALLALIIVAAELYIHFHVYRRLVGRLRALTIKTRGLATPLNISNGDITSRNSSK